MRVDLCANINLYGINPCMYMRHCIAVQVIRDIKANTASSTRCLLLLAAFRVNKYKPGLAGKAM